MKNIVKKIAAAAMAFTLLGNSSAIAAKVEPQANNTLTAHAVMCQYHRKELVKHQYLGESYYEYSKSKLLKRMHQPVRYEYCCKFCGLIIYSINKDIVYDWELN